MAEAEALRLYVIRHGQTQWNLEGRLQGGQDSPLTEKGLRQAAAVAAALDDEPPAAIVASPLGRARRTAEIIAQTLDIGVTEDSRLGELRFGSAEGMTLAQVERHWPELLAKRERDKWHVHWPDGESYHDGDRRIASFVEDVLPSHRAATSPAPLAIVGHETVNKILLGRLLGLEPEVVTRLGQPNAVVYRLQGRLIDHSYADGGDDGDWVPGLLQKKTDDLIHVAPR